MCSKQPTQLLKEAVGFLFNRIYMKRILDIEDVAKLKKVHPGTIYHWIERGILKPIKIERSLFFNRKEILKWQPPKRGRKPNRKGGE